MTKRSKYAISIIMPVYKRPEYTKRTLDNLWETTKHRKDIEYVIVSDGDNSEEQKKVLRAFQRHSPSRTKVKYLPENTGIRNATLECFKLCEGFRVQKIDNDIMFPEGWLDTIEDTMIKHPEVHVLKPNYKETHPLKAFGQGEDRGGYKRSRVRDGGIYMINKDWIDTVRFPQIKQTGVTGQCNPIFNTKASIYAWSTLVTVAHYGYHKESEAVQMYDAYYKETGRKK